jgi:hypothetical protein
MDKFKDETDTEAETRLRLRTAMTEQAVSLNYGSPVTLENIAKLLPPDFGLVMDDLAPFLEQAEPAPGEQIPEAELIAGLEPAPTEQPQAPVEPSTIEAATARRLKADRDLGDARVALITAQNLERDARGRLASTVTTFQTGFTPITQGELLRDNAKEQNEIRRKIASGEMPVRHGPPIGRSAIDRSAFFQRGGSPAGGGRAYSRGARPASMQNAAAKVHGEQ